MNLSDYEIDRLSPPQYICWLVYGDPFICETTTDEEYEEYIRSHYEFDL